MEELFISDYQIVKGKTTEELVSAVKKMIDKEYQPTEAPVFFDQQGNLCQVMILWEE